MPMLATPGGMRDMSGVPTAESEQAGSPTVWAAAILEAAAVASGLDVNDNVAGSGGGVA